MILDIFAQTGTAAGGSSLLSFLPFILIIVIIWFFMIRPQAKKQKETQNMLTALKPHDKILTIGGLYAEIDSIKDDNVVVIKLNKDIKVEIKKSAIAGLAETPAPKK